ncbi:MAG: hypothetical protein J7L61_02145 [Thermoplasmata archaeon]|nr:hypothetical protein [Thermoplasmata archaeon]
MENGNEYAPHVEEIARVLEGVIDIGKDELENELRTYVEHYKVPLYVAKRSIVKKYGGNERLLGGMEWTKLNSLMPNTPSVNFVARVVTANPKEINGPDGPKRIVYGILGDDTATVPFTLWEGSFPYEKGDVIRVRNAYTKEWQGQVQVNMGARTVISPEEPDALPPGFTREVVEAKASELRPGMRNVSTTLRIVDMEKREVEVSGEKKVLFTGLAGDDTGLVRFTSWHDFGLKRDGIYRITGAYVNSWRGVPRLTFDEKCSCDPVEDDSFPSSEEIRGGRLIGLGELVEMGGAVGVTIRGVVIDIKPGSGLISRCPECRRVIQKGTCMVHGKVKGVNDLRIKAILDDGTGAVTTIINRELTERLTGKTMREYEEEARDAMTPEVVRDDIVEKLLARKLEVRGNATSDDFGVMLIAEDARPAAVDVESEARALLQEIEGGA